VHKPEALNNDSLPKRFRRLKAHELVSQGDYVANEHQGFELWEGPGGFRADAFVKAMYRQVPSRSSMAED
jgi:hypothetical protein